MCIHNGYYNGIFCVNNNSIFSTAEKYGPRKRLGQQESKNSEYDDTKNKIIAHNVWARLHLFGGAFWFGDNAEQTDPAYENVCCEHNVQRTERAKKKKKKKKEV